MGGYIYGQKYTPIGILLPDDQMEGRECCNYWPINNSHNQIPTANHAQYYRLDVHFNRLKSTVRKACRNDMFLNSIDNTSMPAATRYSILRRSLRWCISQRVL